jgi:hypothetical protein
MALRGGLPQDRGREWISRRIGELAWEQVRVGRPGRAPHAMNDLDAHPDLLPLWRRCDRIPTPLVTPLTRARPWSHPGARSAGDTCVWW